MNWLPFEVDGYKFFEAVGVWAAAFSTLIAAYVALKIARRQDEIRLTAFVTAAVLLNEGESTEYIWIRVINVGRRTATVNIVGFRLSRIAKKEILLPVISSNPSLPVTLTDGKELSLSWPVEHSPSKNLYDEFAEAFVKYRKPRRWFELKSLRLIVSCTTGENFKIIPSNLFIKEVKKAINRKLEGAV